MQKLRIISNAEITLIDNDNRRGNPTSDFFIINKKTFRYGYIHKVYGEDNELHYCTIILKFKGFNIELFKDGNKDLKEYENKLDSLIKCIMDKNVDNVNIEFSK